MDYLFTTNYGLFFTFFCWFVTLHSANSSSVSGAKVLFDKMGIGFLELRDYLGSFILFTVLLFYSPRFFERTRIRADFINYVAIGAIFSATDSVCTLQVLD